jgi:hypothetical protein
MRNAAPISSSPPMTNRATSIQPRAGTVAPASADTGRPGFPSGLITTTVQAPLVGFQVSVWVPVPDADTAHMDRDVGGTVGAVPKWCR